MTLKKICILTLALLLLTCSCGSQSNKETVLEIPPMGFWPTDYICDSTSVQNGEVFGTMMERLGLGASTAYQLSQLCDTLFDVRKIVSGKKVQAYYDTLSHDLRYVVYSNTRIRSTIFQCMDSLAVWVYDKPVELVDRICDVRIETSLWNDMISKGVSPIMICELSDIYAWTVDFFTLQQNDRFRAFYTEKICEGEVIDIERIDFCLFNRGNKELCAIRFDQGDGGNIYWNEKGESMRKAFLKAPLTFKRVSSRFSYHRKHPVTGKVKAHTGVDYAAAAGTPVHSIGDGTVISVGYAGGGGNTVKIRHNSVYTTGYLHLKGYAKGIRKGAHVSQGQTIGYVGSTGTSTGPHLDFRVWKNGTPINPLTMESPSAEPVRKENLPVIDSLYRHFRPMMGE